MSTATATATFIVLMRLLVLDVNTHGGDTRPEYDAPTKLECDLQALAEKINPQNPGDVYPDVYNRLLDQGIDLNVEPGSQVNRILENLDTRICP